MTGLDFIDTTPPTRADPARADIALFVGFVAPRIVHSLSVREDKKGERFKALRARLPEWLLAWWRERGWLPPEEGFAKKDFERFANLVDIPVPVESWDAFDGLFKWDVRPLDGLGRRADTYLGAAVRGFFRSGGRSCIVVRVGEPALFSSTSDQRWPLAGRLMEGAASSRADRESWHGFGHLFGLPEVSMVCLPDLPDLLAMDPPPQPLPPGPETEERFVECPKEGNCAKPEKTASAAELRFISPPRCDELGFKEWTNCIQKVREFLRLEARETVFLAALPLCEDEKSIEKRGDLFRLPLQTRQRRVKDRLKAVRDAQFKAASEIESAFVQLVYPWLRTRDSGTMPGDLEPPDGALVGMVANLALTRGAWRILTREAVPWLYAVEPILSRTDLDTKHNTRQPPLRERVTIFGFTSSGLRLLSDVTTDDEPLWRPASTVRLMNLLVRAARQAGEQSVFMNNGEELWGRLRRTMDQLLSGLWADGALYGATPAEAFEVRCDRSTMTQADIDAGRAIVRIAFLAAEPIMRIVVSLTMNEAGQLSVSSEETGDLERKAA